MSSRSEERDGVVDDEDVDEVTTVLAGPEPAGLLQDSQNGEERGQADIGRLAEEERDRVRTTYSNGSTFKGYSSVEHEDGSVDQGDLEPHTGSPGKLSLSIDDSLSLPDDTPSVQGSILSSPGSSTFPSQARLLLGSPTPSLMPFDRRFSSRLPSSHLSSPRATSPAFLSNHSRQASLSSQVAPEESDKDALSAPWEVVRWTKLKRISGQAFSEVTKRKFGVPTCISASASIVIGTSKGIILIFDYNQALKSIIGPGTKALESGAITSVAISADHSTVAGGHAHGDIFTWEIARAAKPFLHIPHLEPGQLQARKVDGHTPGVAIIHIGFLGTRHTAIVSADDRGMAFSHLATRGLGAVARIVKTTRILGRYPETVPAVVRPRKPSSILAFSPLPLGNAEQVTDDMGLVAMLTPFLLVIVSTTPIAQTQHKAARPKDIPAHATLSGCLAWFPSVKLKTKSESETNPVSRTKLVYCWSNILTILEVTEAEQSAPSETDRPPSLQFRARSRWKAEEAIVAVQWLGRSIIGVLTITQQLIILEDGSMRMTDAFDIMHRQIYHRDLFSKQLQTLVEQLDDEDASMHGVVADAFFGSFRAYKGRIFLLGNNDVSMGTLSNWADRLLALMEDGDFVGAIRLATSYYTGNGEKLMVGLPEDNELRHSVVESKVYEMMSASLKYALGQKKTATSRSMDASQLQELANACIIACVSMDAKDYLFENVFERYDEGSLAGILLEALEPYVLDGQIKSIPPVVLKELVTYFTSKNLDSRLEDMICNLETSTMDIDQVTTLCKDHRLYDALIYVWNQALGDYITPMINLLSLLLPPSGSKTMSNNEPSHEFRNVTNASKIFPYLAYTFTSRIYPTGETMDPEKAVKAKAEVYYVLFSGRTITWPAVGGKPFLTQESGKDEPPYPYLQMILHFDAPSLLSALNEAFEDGFLNGATDRLVNGGSQNDISEEQVFGLAVTRQLIVSILLETMNPKQFPPEDTIYLDMFVARNLPKFPQFILLSGSAIQRVLAGLCNYPGDDIAEDCQLSVEYLLSTHHPSDLDSLIPLFEKARFFRVLKSTFRTEKKYAKLLQTYFDDEENLVDVFECIADCLRPGAGLTEKQQREVHSVIQSHARDLADIDAVRSAQTIETYAPVLHHNILSALEGEPHTEFTYLQAILEPKSSADNRPSLSLEGRASELIERYVQLMCRYAASHVADFISHLHSASLRLEAVLPAMESSGVVDAAVVLMAREGQVRAAMDRLLAHLSTLESALLGLLRASDDSPDPDNTDEATDDILAAIQKYTQVGIWLCQGQSKAAVAANATQPPTMATASGPPHHPKRPSSLKKGQTDLTADETLWLDLLSSTVRTTRLASVLTSPSPKTTDDQSNAPSPTTATLTAPTALRQTVQAAFTALLQTTSSPPSSASTHTRIRFLPILTALLTSLSTTSSTSSSSSSPSLAELRQVLQTIFAAYAYEEGMLRLAEGLLESDLFLSVDELRRGRERGWKARSVACEGCGRRVWGAGAGGGVWERWEKRRQGDARVSRWRTIRQGGASPEGEGSSAEARGKGKAVMSRNSADTALERPSSASVPEGSTAQPENAGNANSQEAEEEDLGPLVVFACRHIFHRACLQKLLTKDGEAPLPAELQCLVCK